MTLLDEVLDGVYRKIPDEDQEKLRVLVNDRLIGERERRRAAAALLAGEPRVSDDEARPSSAAAELQLVRACDVRMKRVKWVWKDRIPAGMATLIAGREGMGKTAFVGHLMARLTRGELPGDRYGRPANVVYVGAEDEPASVLVPRLEAARADLSRVQFVKAPALFQASDAPALAVKLEDLADVAMVVVDPLDAHLGERIDTHRKAEVQRAFAALVEALTVTHPCAVVGIAHLNKGDSLDVLRRVVGSVGFTTSARSVLAVGEHPDEPRDRVCVARKANMADVTATPALRFRIEGTEVPDPEGGDPIPTAAVVILGEEDGIDPDAILRVPSAEERTERDEAADWLAELLTTGPLAKREIDRTARDDGIALRTLQRARESLGVVITRDEHARGRPSTWRLPGPQGSGEGDSGQAPNDSGGTKPVISLTSEITPHDWVSCHESESDTKPKGHPPGGGLPEGDDGPPCSRCGEPDAHLALDGRIFCGLCFAQTQADHARERQAER